MRLVNGASANEGTLELCLYTQWGTVSNYSFSSNDAKVICRMLGYDVDSNGAGDECLMVEILNLYYHCLKQQHINSP